MTQRTTDTGEDMNPTASAREERQSKKVDFALMGNIEDIDVTKLNPRVIHRSAHSIVIAGRKDMYKIDRVSTTSNLLA